MGLPDLSFLRNFSWASGRIKTESILNPLLWLNGLSIPAVVLIGIFGTGPLAWVLSVPFMLIFCASFFVYIYVLKTAPDRLHSEEHQLELRRMELLGDDVSKSTSVANGTLVPRPNIGVDQDGRS